MPSSQSYATQRNTMFAPHVKPLYVVVCSVDQEVEDCIHVVLVFLHPDTQQVALLIYWSTVHICEGFTKAVT